MKAEIFGSNPAEAQKEHDENEYRLNELHCPEGILAQMMKDRKFMIDRIQKDARQHGYDEHPFLDKSYYSVQNLSASFLAFLSLAGENLHHHEHDDGQDGDSEDDVCRETHVVWYKSGVGVFREVKMTVTDQASADALASKLVVGSKGQLIVTSNVPGADVFVDGKRVGMSAEFKENAMPIDLVEGKYIVTIRKDGFTKEDAVSVVIEGDKTAEVHINMAVATDPEVVRRGILIGGYTFVILFLLVLSGLSVSL